MAAKKRPPIMITVNLKMPPDLIADVDEARAIEDRDRANMLRRLIRLGLETWGKEPIE
jgi:hypothetical protein